MPGVTPPPDVEAVVVHAPRLPDLGGAGVFAVQQIDAATLATAGRLDQALKQAPGVSLFRRTGSDGANPTIQGLSLRSIAPSGAGRALVTLDGAPQNDPFGGWVVWSSLPPEGLDGATVVRGAGSGPYGAGALTGVVALRERGLGGGLTALDLSGGSRGFARAAFAFGADNLLVTAAASTTDGYIPVRGAARGPVDQSTTLDDRTLSARAQGRIGAVRAAVRLGVYEERRGAGLAGADSTALGRSAALTLGPATGGAGGWRLQAWVRSSDLKNTSVAVAPGRLSTTPANNQFSTPATGYGLNGALQGRSGDLSWEMGADARLAEGHEAELFRVVGGQYTRLREAGGQTVVGGVYAEGVLDREGLVLTGGLRVDGWRSTDAYRRERDIASGALLLNQASADRSGVTPTARLGARWTLSGTTWSRAAAYAGFRPPTLNELHRPFRVGNDVTEANPGLKPETLYGVEAGIGGARTSGVGEATWSLTLFVNRMQDPIANVTLGVGPATFPVAGFIPAGGVLRQRQNAGRIDAVGLEGELTGALGQDLSWRLAGTATRARVDGGASAPQLTGKRPAQTPRLTITAGGAWRPVDGFSLSADLRFESKRFEDDLNTRTLAASVGVDARAAWRVSPIAEVYLAAENLFDSRIEVAEAADGTESFAAPRTVRVGFSIRR